MNLAPASIRNFRMPLLVATCLVLSGLVHLWFVLSGAQWEGPVSPRKPALFGISTGLTLYSLIWVLTKLQPQRFDRLVANLLALIAGVEVGFITLQYWRGVPSHFNRATTLDATMEGVILGLICVVTLVIVLLTVRSVHLPYSYQADRIAIRGGLGLLSVSCLLGFAITGMGHWNLSVGKPAEVWGTAGILKYPHGAALHAIQLLPAVSWLLQRLRVGHSAMVVGMVVWSQALFLIQTIWLVLHGRSRIDVDWMAGVLLITSAVCLFIPAISIVSALVWTYVNTKNAESV